MLNPNVAERTKHIDIGYKCIYGRVINERDFGLQQVRMDKMIADGMTKPLLKTSHDHFSRQLGITGPQT